MAFKDLLTCFEKDFKFYFQSNLVYLAMLIYLMLSAGLLLYASDFYLNTTANFYQFFKLQPGILAMVIPVLTMRLWADEYKYNTLEILFTQPINTAAAAIGKFLAVWLVVGIMLLSSVGIWLFVGLFTSTDVSWVLVNYGLTFLMAGSLCAVSAAAAAFCYSAPAAFLSATMLCVLLSVTGFGSWIEEILPDSTRLIKLTQAFDFEQQFDELISGKVSLSSIAYFVIIMVTALWTGAAAVEYKRS